MLLFFSYTARFWLIFVENVKRNACQQRWWKLPQLPEETDETEADDEQSQRSVIEGDRQEGEVFN